MIQLLLSSNASFSPNFHRLDPTRHIVAGKFLELPKEEQEKLTIHQGWISKRGEDLAKVWTKRYALAITEPKGLIYFYSNPFEDESNFFLKKLAEATKQTLKPKARGFIDASTILEVQMYAKSKTRWTILTTGRKWHFR